MKVSYEWNVVLTGRKCEKQKVMNERIKKVLKAESYEKKDKGSVKSRKLWKKG